MTAPLRFGRFELWSATRQLLSVGQPVAIGGRAFDLLCELVAQRHRVVSQDELLERVWPGMAVEPNNLQVQIWALRKLLGPGFIVTVARRGYRFMPDPLAQPAPLPIRRKDPLDLQALMATLADQRWVTLVGPAPAALLRLALACARRLADANQAPLWQLDAATLAAALDAAAPEPAADRLLRSLRMRPGTVVLTTPPPPPQGLADRLAGLLRQAPSMHLLVVSHQALGHPDEQVVAPLGLPARRGTAGHAEPVLRWRLRGR